MPLCSTNKNNVYNEQKTHTTQICNIKSKVLTRKRRPNCLSLCSLCVPCDGIMLKMDIALYNDLPVRGYYGFHY